MKHSWVASEAGITAATLSNILTGRTADPSFSVVVAIARAIGAPLASILEEPSAPLLAEEQEVLRQAVDILERRVLRSRTRSTSLHAAEPEVDPLPRHAIPSAISARGARMAVRAIGGSLEDEGIRDGTIVYIKPVASPRIADGRIVLCRVNGAMLLRKLVLTGRSIRLLAGSEDRDYVTVSETDSFELLGVAVAHLGEI